MSDSYQAIYDAIRSRISGGNIPEAVQSAVREAFDMGNLREMAWQAVVVIQNEHTRPSVLFRPTLTQDGNAWIALYGENIAVGVVGCGASPDLAMADFDAAWVRKQPQGESGGGR